MSPVPDMEVDVNSLLPMVLGEAQPKGMGLDMILIWMIPLIVVLWLMNRWSKKKEQEERKKKEGMLESLRKRDSVVTIGGINGEVASVSDKYIVLRVDPQKDVRIRFDKQAIKSVVRRGDKREETEEEAKDSEAGS